jgi:acyl-ACP thioesterase
MSTQGYKCVRTVNINETDFRRELKLSALLGMFQEAAEPASVELGFGFDVMRERFNAAWILTRIRVDIMEPAVWRDELVIETWNRRHSRVTFERDFIARSARGGTVAAAVTSWVVLDVDTRAMKTAADFGFNIPDIDMPRAIDCSLGRIRSPIELEPVYIKSTRYSDIDVNGHVNNARYVDFAMDCIPIERHMTHRVSSIEIGYVNEAREGDAISLRCASPASEPDAVYIDGVDAKSDAAFFRVRAVMSPRGR